jgi:hypothetical protein
VAGAISDRNSAGHLSIASRVILAAATAKEFVAAALGVAVGGRRAVALLLLVDATKAELDEGRNEEETTEPR